MSLRADSAGESTPDSSATNALLSVRNLTASVAVPTRRDLISDLSFDIAPGESVGIVGASGSGKTSLGMALLGMLPEEVRVGERSSIRLGNQELTQLGNSGWRSIRGKRIAMVFQEPLLALNPAMRIGEQLSEALRAHNLGDPADDRDRLESMLDRVGFSDPAAAAGKFPHEFSGGMRQRLLIAAALLPEPELLIADEPTTALDVTLQAQILNLLDELRRSAANPTALILISHDLDVVAERAERLLVMENGILVESGETASVLASPKSHAARELTEAHHLGDRLPDRSDPEDKVVSVSSLSVRYAASGFFRTGNAGVTAASNISLELARGETLGIVGESGSGKSSLVNAILRLTPAAGGSIQMLGRDVLALGGKELRTFRKRVQLIPQDAGASLTPHMTVESLIAEGMEVHHLGSAGEIAERVRSLIERVGLTRRFLTALPSRLSSGERQRVAIARALAVDPEILICDEPVSAVDSVVKRRLLALLDELRYERRLSMIFVSHDLAAVRRIASRVMVMHRGEVVEEGWVEEVMTAPKAPYTRSLLASIPGFALPGR